MAFTRVVLILKSSARSNFVDPFTNSSFIFLALALRPLFSPALAAAILTHEERHTRRDVEPAVGDELRDGRDREWPRRRIGRVRWVGRPVDALEVAGLHGHAVAEWRRVTTVRAVSARSCSMARFESMHRHRSANAWP